MAGSWHDGPSPHPAAKTNGRGATEPQRLIERALWALNVTPASIAAREGLDPRDLPLLLAGVGDPDEVARLAVALERAAADLESLARELSAAARDGGSQG